MKDIHVVLGTRPEVTKTCAIALALKDRRDLRLHFFHTGQQFELVREAILDLGLSSILGLPPLPPDGLAFDALWAKSATTRFTQALSATHSPAVLVQGDTASALLGAEIAHDRVIDVCHLEAGLRLGHLVDPEERNRRAITRLATLHCVPTEKEEGNLLSEGIDVGQIIRTGDLSELFRAFVNGQLPSQATHAMTICEALTAIDERCPPLDSSHGYYLCTFHRPTSLANSEQLARWIVELTKGTLPDTLLILERPDTRWLPFYDELRSVAGVCLAEAAHPRAFQLLLKHARAVITDSAGVQQEAILAGKHVVVTRSETELYKMHRLCRLVPPPFADRSQDSVAFLQQLTRYRRPISNWRSTAGRIAGHIAGALTR